MGFLDPLDPKNSSDLMPAIAWAAAEDRQLGETLYAGLKRAVTDAEETADQPHLEPWVWVCFVPGAPTKKEWKGLLFTLACYLRATGSQVSREQIGELWEDLDLARKSDKSGGAEDGPSVAAIAAQRQLGETLYAGLKQAVTDAEETAAKSGVEPWVCFVPLAPTKMEWRLLMVTLAYYLAATGGPDDPFSLGQLLALSVKFGVDPV